LMGNSRLVVPSFKFTCRVVTYLSSRYRFTLAYQFLNPVCDKSTLIAAGCLAKEKFWFNRDVTYKSFVSVSEPTLAVQTGTFSDLRCVATRATSPPALSRPSVINRMPACFRP